MAGASFSAELVDKISGPAKAAAASMNRLAASMRKAQARAGKANGVYRDAGGRLRDLKGRFAAAGGGIDSLSGKLTAVIGGLGKAWAVIGGIMAAVGVAVGAFAVKIVKTAAQVQSMQNTFGRLFGSMDKGKAAFKEIGKLATELGLDTMEAATQYRDLIMADFKPAAAKEIIALSADMMSYGRSAEDVSGIIRAMSQIKAGPVLQKEELNQLAERGIAYSKVMEQLGKQLGISAEEATKLQKAGKITSEQGLKAIKATMLALTQSEKAGDAARAATKSLGGQWTQMKNSAKNALIEVATRLLPKLTEALGPISKDIVDAFSGPQAQQAMDWIVEAGGWAIDKLVELWPDIKAGAKTAWDAIKSGVEGFKEFMPHVESAFDSLKEAFKGLGDVDLGGIMSLMKAWGKHFAIVIVMIVGGVKMAVGAFKMLAAAANIVMAPFKAIGSVLSGIGEALSGVGETIMGAVTGIGDMVGALDFGGMAASVGSSLVSGIASGIWAGASAVISAATSVASSAIAAAKSALGIASPSKVFEGMGVNVAEGMQQGIQAGSPGIDSAVAGMVDPGKVGGSSNTVTNNTKTTVPVSMTVNAAEEPEATAAAIKNMLISELSGTFEQIALEIGVVPVQQGAAT